MMSAQLAVPTPATKNPWLKVLIALGAFFLISWPVSFACRSLFPNVAWLPQTMVKLVMLAASIAATLSGGRALGEIGFRPQAVRLTWRAVGAGAALGIVATLVMFTSGAQGIRPFMKNLSFGQIVLTVWILSSFSEEVFCRGWFQTWVLGTRHEQARAPDLLLSAALFGAMHLGLLLSGIDVLTVVLLVPMVTLLGWVTSWARARSGSLYPAIASHVAFNVGGMVGGIIYRIVTGHLPG